MPKRRVPGPNERLPSRTRGAAGHEATLEVGQVELQGNPLVLEDELAPSG